MQSNSEVSFLKSLFDFQLRHFITLSVLRFLYAILTFLVLLGGLIIIIGAMVSGDPRMALLYVVLVPLGVLLYLIFIRLYVELLANLQRIGDNTQKMLDQSSSN
jgi:ABC-type bacteriocin/lantibiotic exporter with double-glycine peptidase domain